MRRSLLVLLSLLFLAFCAITISRWRASGPVQREESSRADREDIVSFWAAHQKATQLRTSGDFAGAERFYRQALELDPDHEECLYYLGACLFEQGNYGAARDTYQQLLDRNPLSQRGQAQMGSLLSMPLPGLQMEPDQALLLFKSVSEANPEESGSFLRQGLLRLRQGLLDQAYESFQTAAGFRSPEGLFLSGFVRFRQNRFAEAIAQFDRVLAVDRREREISGRGVSSEGDVNEGEEGKPLTPLAASALKSSVFRQWSALHSGDLQTSGTEGEVVPAPTSGSNRARRVALGQTDSGGQGAWGDFDGDGDLDLAIGGSSGAPRILLQKEGQLSPAGTTWDVATKGSLGLAAADIDRDGDNDLLVSEGGYWTRGQVALYRNEGGWDAGPGRFAAIKESALSQSRTCGRPQFLDFNNDGRIDLIEVASGAPSLRLFAQLEDGGFDDQTSMAGLSFSGTAVDVAVGDWNQDGREDLFVVRWKQPGLLFENAGGGSFRDVTTGSGIVSPGESYGATFIDWNRDGQPDLFVSRFSSYEAVLLYLAGGSEARGSQPPALFQNLGGGSFRDVSSEAGLGRGYGTLDVQSADVDGDGWPDLVLSNGGYAGDRLESSVVLLNRKGRFADPLQLPPDGTPSSSASTAAADFDRDGRTEVFVSGIGLFKIRR